MAITKKTVKGVVELKTELEDRDSARNSSYDEVLTFYGGDTLKNVKKKGFLPGVTQALSSIFTPKEQDEGAVLTTPINLVKPAIENKVAFLALPPTIRVIEPPDQLAPIQQGPGAIPGAGAPVEDNPMMGGPQTPSPTPQGPPLPGAPAAPLAPGPTNEDWGTDFADRLEKVIQTLLQASNLPQRCRDVAWSMCAMDGAVIGVWPDIRHGRPRLFSRTPQDFYPISYDPDGLELQTALWVETVTGNDIVARYGEKFKSYAGRDEVEVIQCIDEVAFYTVLDKKEWAHEPMENKMGVVPIVCVGNLGLPGMIFGSTDIKDAIPVAKEINYHMSLVDEMAGALVRPTVTIKDPLEFAEGFGIGRGGTITMGKDGSVELLGPLTLPNAFWQLGGQLQNWFDIISDNPNVLRSDDGGGLTTGKGFNAKLGPIAARMQTRLEILMSAWRQVIKYMLMMWADFPGMKSVTATGIKMKESFYIEAQPQDFMVNGTIWTEMDVFLNAQSFMDRQGTDVELMQLYQNELIDWDTAADNLQYITNKKRTRQRIDKDRQWKATGMAIAQGAAQSAMTANTDIGAQQRTNYGLERGFMGETGPMPGPEGKIAPPGAPPPGAAPGGPPLEEMEAMEAGAPPEMGMAAPQGGELVSVLQEFFSGIPKLRGSVWFGGDPIKRVEKLAGDNWTVDVWITDPQDKGTITNAAKNVEVVYGHIRFHTGQPDPAEGAIQVAAGAPQPAAPPVPGEAPPPEGPAAGAPGGLPPEMMQMLGGGM